MKTISQLAALYAKNQPGPSLHMAAAANLDAFAKAQGYTITITPPPTVAAWRLEMQRICRVLLDIDMVDASGLTEHEYAHNAKLRQLWQDKADRLRAAYPSQVQS